jgi:dolichol kinase
MEDKKNKLWGSHNKAGDPFNIQRKLFHGIGLLVPVIFYFNLFDSLSPNSGYLEPTRTIGFFILSSLFLFLVSVELLRFNIPAFQELFLKVAGPLIKEKEQNKINAAVPYILALALVCAFLPRDIVVLSLLYLTFGDPMAAYIGGKYGTIRFYNGKSLQGTVGAMIGASIIGFGFMILITLFFPANSQLLLWSEKGVNFSSIGIIIAGAIAAFIIEFVSSDGFLDDNLTIPLGSGVVMTVLLGATKEKDILHFIYSIQSLLYPV